MSLKKFIYLALGSGAAGYICSLVFAYYALPFNNDLSSFDLLRILLFSLLPSLLVLSLLAYFFYKPITKAKSYSISFKRCLYLGIATSLFTGFLLSLLNTFFSYNDFSWTYTLIYMLTALLYGFLGALIAALLLSLLTYKSNKAPDNLS